MYCILGVPRPVSDDDDDEDGIDAGAGFHRHQRTAVDELTDEFRMKMSVPGTLTKRPTKPKPKVYLAEDSTPEEIIYWLSVKGFGRR